MVGGPNDSLGMIGLLVHWIAGLLMSRFMSRKFVMFIAKRSQEDLRIIAEWMETGKVTPVIDRHYTLPRASEAIRYLETGHARGKVVISVG